MKLNRIKKIIFLFCIMLTTSAVAQDRFTSIEIRLKELAKDNPGLNEKVELSVNGVSIPDFIRGLAIANNLNISVDPNISVKIVNNFSNVTVSDVLLFLCKKYDLDISFIGNIMSFSHYALPPPPIVKFIPKSINISYDKTTDQLSMDLSHDSLASVAKTLTKVTLKNVVFSPDLAGKMVSAYIQNMSFNSAMDKFAFANDLKVTPTNDNFYLIEKVDANTSKSNSGKPNLSASGPGSSPQGLSIRSAEAKLSVDATNVAISDILSGASAELKNSYFLFTEPKGNTSLSIKNATYDEFLGYLFNGTDYTFRKEGDIYLIGDRNLEGIRSTKVLSLKYRTIDKVIDFIPADLKKGVDIKTFQDQNSLIVSGSPPRIAELESFIRDIDRIVPVISIEVIIMDVNNTHTVTTGIRAGLGDKPVTTGGSVFPELDIRFGANSLNAIIDGINGLGIVNLGKVTPNFYVSLQALEQNGDVKINSTPLLATLNGTKASMSVGETRYYEENTSNVITTQSTTTVSQKIYKPLQAEFTMTINPIVSGDEQITLDITVKQSSFTNQSSGKGSPYNTSSRDFQSLIRVKNQEMIMLGGLDNDSKNETSSGVPILSRIPIIKWIFSSRSKSKTKSKLTIFIKPTVIY